MRKRIVVGNWKMNLLRRESSMLAEDVVSGTSGIEDVRVVLVPPFTSLDVVAARIKGTRVELGAQNVSWEEYGELTGEVSAPMLKDSGCGWVIVGHSERRAVFGETEAMIGNKIRACLKSGLVPIMCVGESQEEKQQGKTERVVEAQIVNSLVGIELEGPEFLVIAYEPVWAIGTGENPHPDEVELVHNLIRDSLERKFGLIAQEMCLLYGGSVNVENIRGLLSPDNVDGVLVGGASLNADAFNKIVSIAGEI